MEDYKYAVDRGVRIKRSQITNNDYNPNKTTERQQEAIAESLDYYGQLTAVLVRPDPDDCEKYIIIDGEHRSQVLNDEVYVDVVHGLTENDAKRLTIIMNETRGSADKIELSQLLAQINQDLDDFEQLQIGLPYQEVELHELIDLADIDWDQFEQENNENNNNDGNNNSDPDDHWTTIACRVPNESLEAINAAMDLIRDAKDLHKDKAIANGQVLEILAAEYLAIPNVSK